MNTYTVLMRYEMAYTTQVKAENEQAAEAQAYTDFHQGNLIPESEYVADSLQIKEITFDKAELSPQQRSLITEMIKFMNDKVKELEQMMW